MTALRVSDKTAFCRIQQNYVYKPVMSMIEMQALAGETTSVYIPGRLLLCAN